MPYFCMGLNFEQNSLHCRKRIIFAVECPSGHTEISFNLHIPLHTVSQPLRKAYVQRYQFSSIRSNVPCLSANDPLSCKWVECALPFPYDPKLLKRNFIQCRDSQFQRQWVSPWSRNYFSLFFYQQNRQLSLPSPQHGIFLYLPFTPRLVIELKDNPEVFLFRNLARRVLKFLLFFWKD